jgi:hypothetical protein
MDDFESDAAPRDRTPDFGFGGADFTVFLPVGLFRATALVIDRP